VNRALLIPVLFLLAGCAGSPSVPSQLPPVPADIQQCFRIGVGKVPPRALTVAEVETLWKNDRVRAVVMQRCGNRFLAWYDSLRRSWK
jgi:hypothetical protein